jgi:hypothetical protein
MCPPYGGWMQVQRTAHSANIDWPRCRTALARQFDVLRHPNMATER